MTHLRSAAAALVCGGLALAAHGASGGALSTVGVFLLIPIALVAGHHAVLAFNSARLWALGLSLAAGQVASHTVLHLAGLQHPVGHGLDGVTAGPPAVTLTMVSAHAVATLVCAALLLWADQLIHIVSTTLRSLFVVLEGLPVRERSIFADRTPYVPPRALEFIGSTVSLRGPPVHSAECPS